MPITSSIAVHAYIDAMDSIEGNLGGIFSKTDFVQDDPSYWTDRGEQPETDLFWAFLAK